MSMPMTAISAIIVLAIGVLLQTEPHPHRASLAGRAEARPDHPISGLGLMVPESRPFGFFNQDRYGRLRARTLAESEPTGSKRQLMPPCRHAERKKATLCETWAPISACSVSRFSPAKARMSWGKRIKSRKYRAAVAQRSGLNAGKVPS